MRSRTRVNSFSAAVVSAWSRAYMSMADACLLVTRGSYVSVPNLVRSACELIAVQNQLHHEEMAEFVGWMLGHLKPVPEPMVHVHQVSGPSVQAPPDQASVQKTGLYQEYPIKAFA